VKSGPRCKEKVRGALDAAKFEIEEPGKGLDDQRLGDSGHAFQQRVAAAQDGEQALVDQVILADNDFGQLSSSVRKHLRHGLHAR